jgi:hypothetical protein
MLKSQWPTNLIGKSDQLACDLTHLARDSQPPESVLNDSLVRVFRFPKTRVTAPDTFENIRFFRLPDCIIDRCGVAS